MNRPANLPTTSTLIASLMLIACCSFMGCSDNRENSLTDEKTGKKNVRFRNGQLELTVSIKPLDAATLRQAIKTLREASVFEWGVGLSSKPGGQNDNEIATSAILNFTNALDIFEAVLTNATPPGKLYALCGIHRLDPARFRQLAPSVAETKLAVATKYECLVFSDVPLSGIIADIATGRFDRELEPRPWRWVESESTSLGWVYAPLETEQTTNGLP